MSILDNRTFQAVVSAVWLAFLAVLGVNFAGNLAMTGSLFGEVEKVEKCGYPIEAVEEEAAGGGGAAAGGPRPDIKPLILAAKPEDGAAVFRKCASCHTVDPGGKNGTGPNLHNIVGDAIGDRNGFKTSDSLKAIPGGKWTYEILDDYVENPKHLAPKGTMSFAGLKKPADRAAVIKFLMANTENPPPVPASAPAAEAAPAAAPAAEPKK